MSVSCQAHSVSSSVGAARPDRLADAPRRAALGQQGQDEVGPGRDDPRRVAADRPHVGQLQERVLGRQGLAEELEPLLGHGDQHGLARARPSSTNGTVPAR